MKLQNGETIKMVIKNHIFVYFVLGIYFLLFLVILGLIYYFFSHNKYIYLIIIFLFQVFLIFIYNLCLKYELQTIVFTNLRIIGVKKINIFSYDYFEDDIMQIIEVKIKSKGFFSNILGLGELKIFSKNGDFFLRYCSKSTFDLMKKSLGKS